MKKNIAHISYLYFDMMPLALDIMSEFQWSYTLGIIL